MLDEGFRHRVGRLARADGEMLAGDARERVARRVGLEGPWLVRRARRLRIAMLAVGPLLAAAAVAALVVRERPRVAPPRVTEEGRAASGVRSWRMCEGRAVLESTRRGFVPEATGARLELGLTGLAAASPGSRVEVAETSPCRTVIGLVEGSVAVHAKDLGGGDLVVRARDGDVTVHGTIFAVTQTADAFVVEVLEGRVLVRARVGAREVGSGERFSVSAVGVAQGVLAMDRRDALRAQVGAPKIVGFDTLETLAPEPSDDAQASRGVPSIARGPGPVAPVSEAKELVGEAVPSLLDDEPVAAPAAPEPAPPATSIDLLARADQARHDGNYAGARNLYRQAAAGRGVTAEAAWVALARMELSLGHVAQAREATKQRQERFGQGTLAPEALWIDVRTYRQTGEIGRARELAEELVQRWPSSPQARAAAQWLSGE